MRNERIVLFYKGFIFFLILLLLWFIHFRGFISYDDGWFLYDGLRLLQGEKIYKDFHYLYNPGSLYINALAFKLFGVSIFASRILAFLNSVISVTLLYLTSKKVRLNPLLSILLILSYVIWGPAHVNFVWPVMFCLTLALACGTIFLYTDKAKQHLFLLLIGIFTACVFILKQNFGLAILATNIAYLLYQKEYRNYRSFLWFGIGYVTLITLQLFYFLVTNTLDSYLYEFYDYTIVKIIQQGILNSALPWQYPAPYFYQIIKFFLYIAPLIICVTSTIKLMKEKSKKYLLYIPLVGCSFYLLSIRPTTDYIHLAPLIALSLVPLFILYQENHNMKQKIVISLIILFIFLSGIYSAFYRNYYRWNTPLSKQQTYVNNEKVKIFTDDKEKESMTQIMQYYEENAKDETYTFIYYFTPIYYLLLDKKNPTMYDDLQLGGVVKNEQRNITKILKDKNVKHVLTDVNITEDPSVIALFIKENYSPVKKINEYTIWKQK